jgi:hypothetical protein
MVAPMSGSVPSVTSPVKKVFGSVVVKREAKNSQREERNRESFIIGKVFC